MTPTAIREAQAVGYPRDKMSGIWWASSENDVQNLGPVAKGYNGITIHNSPDPGKVPENLKKYLSDKGQGTDTDGKYVGTLPPPRSTMNSMLQAETIPNPQHKYGQGNP